MRWGSVSGREEAPGRQVHDQDRLSGRELPRACLPVRRRCVHLAEQLDSGLGVRPPERRDSLDPARSSIMQATLTFSWITDSSRMLTRICHTTTSSDYVPLRSGTPRIRGRAPPTVNDQGYRKSSRKSLLITYGDHYMIMKKILLCPGLSQSRSSHTASLACVTQSLSCHPRGTPDEVDWSNLANSGRMADFRCILA